MPDISMCMRNDCRLMNICYRHEAVPDKYQSYILPKLDENNICENYWEMSLEEIKERNCRIREEIYCVDDTDPDDN